MIDPISIAIIAGSALLKHQADRQAQNRQESIRRAMEAFQLSKSRESQAATEALLEKQTPKAREDELAQLTADRARSMRETVESAAPAPTVIAGNLSADYERSQEAAANSVAERTRRAIQQMAAMGAPGEQQQKFGIRHGRAAGVVDASNSASERVGGAYMNDISNVRPNPFLTLASEIGQGVGMGMMFGGAGGAAEAGGTGVTAGTAGEGLRAGTGEAGLRVGGAQGIRPRLRFAFDSLQNPYSVWGGG